MSGEKLILESQGLHLGEIYIHVFALGALPSPPPEPAGTHAESWWLLVSRVQRQSSVWPEHVESEGENLRKEGVREEGAPNLHRNFDQILRGPLNGVCEGRLQEPSKKQSWKVEERSKL